MPARRVVLSHGDRERYIELEPGKDCLIGRQLDANFFLNDPSVSRRHCLLRATATGVELEDLVSRNSTFVNGQRVMTRTLLSDGGVLQIGKLSFGIRFLDGAPQTPCAGCGREFDATELSGAPDGRAFCQDCLQHYSSRDEERLHRLVEAQGYVIKEALGGLPATFRVERAGVGKPFTIKAVEMKDIPPNRVEGLLEEARLLATLDHRSIVSIYDLMQVEGVFIMVLAHDRGEPLEEAVKSKGQAAPEAALEIARRCAEGVQYASGKGVVHGEITPANILLGDGFPNRIDARIANFPVTRDFSELSRSFSAGSGIHRLIYVAPEVVKHPEAKSVHADIFGIGAVLLYALTGRSPWGTIVNPNGHVRRLVSGGPIQAELDGVPPAFKAVLEQLLAYEPGDRPATPDAVIALLAKLPGTSAHGQEVGVIQGAFHEDELIEYLQLLELNRKSGDVDIWGGGVSGKLGFFQGKLDSAVTTSGLQGVQAARHLIALPQGTFRFTPGRPVAPKGMTVNLAALLLDVVRERDERRSR